MRGSRRSGWRGWSCYRKIRPDSGNAMGITCTETRGPKNASGMAGKVARRTLLGGAAAAGSALAWNWNRIPFGFVKQYWAEMDRQIMTPVNMPDPKRWPDKGIHAAWLGHSTVLM